MHNLVGKNQETKVMHNSDLGVMALILTMQTIALGHTVL